MSARAAAGLVWTLWALSLALTALSLFLLVLNFSHPGVSIYPYWAQNVLCARFLEGRVLSGARAFTEWHHVEYGKVSGKEKPT